jgi:iron uptake system EfeUOB component EfeO/EfeM
MDHRGLTGSPTTGNARRAGLVVAAVVVVAVVGVLASTRSTTDPAAASPGPAPAHHSPTRSAGRALATAATAATAAYRTDVGDDTAAFVAAVDRLQSDLASGTITAARTDELAAQAAYDGFRMLEQGNTVIASFLDERSTDVAPGQTFAGLHAVERYLWSGPDGPLTSGTGATALTAEGTLVVQAPVIRYLLARDALGPEAIGSTAVDELSWIDDVAVPGQEEQYSRLDAVDIAATEAAAQAAFAAIQPLAHLVAPALTADVAGHFAGLGAQVAALGDPDQRPDGTIPGATLLALAQQVDATATPLARLSALLAPYGTAGSAS